MLLTRPEQSIFTGITRDALLGLRCPRCRRDMEYAGEECNAVCDHCGSTLTSERGVWKALLPERESYFYSFVEDYEFIRSREGRGSSNADYYLALPYRDLSGHNESQWAIRARTFAYLQNRILPHIAEKKNARLRILDLGAGNCWMSYRLACQAHSPVAVDLVTNPQDGLEAGAHYASHLPALFPRFQAELDNLPFSDHQFDVAIFNASFHYSENYETTLAEAIRCLRPGGTVVVADTAWYRDEKDGERMLAERYAAFIDRFGFPSDEICSQEYLTDGRLDRLAKRFGITWEVHTPSYGIRWRLRPWVAKLRGARTPSRFRIHTARVAG